MEIITHPYMVIVEYFDGNLAENAKFCKEYLVGKKYFYRLYKKYVKIGGVRIILYKLNWVKATDGVMEQKHILLKEIKIPTKSQIKRC